MNLWEKFDIEREKRGIPSISISVVKDGEILQKESFGYRDFENQKKATPETLYALASTTKAFTATALGILKDEGKIDFDIPVKAYMPEIILNDPVATAQMTLRDMLCHRTGLSRNEFIWHNTPLSRENILQILPYLKSNRPFRYTYEYNNIMYILASLLIERVAKKPWQAFITEKILTPLGMKDTIFSVDDMVKSSDYARPYNWVQKKNLKALDFVNFDNLGGAGCMISTVSDMANWMIMHLNQGKFKGKEIISSKTLAELHTSQVTVPRGSRINPYAPIDNYALGFHEIIYKGKRTLFHSGALDGFRAQVFMLPDENIGVNVLTNRENNYTPHAIVRHIVDEMLDQPPTNWFAFYDDMAAREDAADSKEPVEIIALRKDSSLLPLEAFEGVYSMEHVGDMIIRKTNDHALEASFFNRKFILQHNNNLYFEGKRLHSESKKLSLFHFELNEKGEVDTFHIPLDPYYQQDWVFQKNQA